MAAEASQIPAALPHFRLSELRQQRGISLEEIANATKISLRFLRAIEAVESAKSKARGDEKLGFEIVAQALRSPAHQIAQNAGEDGDVVVDEILSNKNPAWGYNAASAEYVDMFKAGIIDPTKVARTALLNAASVSGLALTTEVLITELKEKKGEELTPVAGAVV